jgi:Protein of unknown function (DUF3137)
MLKILNNLLIGSLFVWLFLMLVFAIFKFTQGIMFLLAVFFVLVPATFIVGKMSTSQDLNEQINNPQNTISFENLSQYVDNSIKNLSKIEFEKRLKDYNSKIKLGIIFCLSIFLSFLLLPFVLFPIGIWLIIKTRKDISALRSYFLLNLDIPDVSNTQIISKEIFDKTQLIVIIKKILVDNLNPARLGVVDFCTFDYKNKQVALINFWWGNSEDNNDNKYYSCLITNNPDKTGGKTLAWSGRKFGVKFSGQNFNEIIETESVVFDKLFKMISTNQIEARLHLKTNVMQDMIDLAQKRETILYFDQNLVFIITRTNRSLLDLIVSFGGYQKKHQENMVKNIKYTVERKLKIFDEFWLNRKSYLK